MMVLYSMYITTDMRHEHLSTIQRERERELTFGLKECVALTILKLRCKQKHPYLIGWEHVIRTKVV